MGHESDRETKPAEAPPAVSSTAPPPATPAPTTPEIPPHTHEPEGLRWTFWAKFAALLFFVGYAAAFIVGNDKPISVDFVFATGRVSLIWTILLLLLVGLAAGVLFGHLYRRHGSKKAGKA